MKWIYTPQFCQLEKWQHASSGGRWRAVFLWECSFRKRSLLHKFCLLTGKIPGWKQKQTPIQEENFSFFFFFKPAGIVSKPFQVRALSVADHLASVSNGFNTRPRLRRSTTKFQPPPIQLCFVFSMHALVHKAVQKSWMTRDYLS